MNARGGTDRAPGLVRLAALGVLLAVVASGLHRRAAVDEAAAHRNADGSPRYTNRLAGEASPYLRQHAHNPVDWYPWGDEAFAKARAENKPVFLSIGYSTCHWCHVMEEESFEDEEIAAVLNEHYVAIKVDREQRPDIDAVYMAAVQAMGVGGGWPMTVWLTPDRKPFYGGTYFPPRGGERGVRVGLLELLPKLDDAYHGNPDRVAAAAADVVGRLQRAAATSRRRRRCPMPRSCIAPMPSCAPTSTPSTAASARRRSSRVPRRSSSCCATIAGPATPRRSTWSTRTLDAMAAGGIHDQLGGGFHRYATDRAWLVPHFEKMLYDNALLAAAYLEASQASGRPDLAEVARRTLDWITRDMHGARRAASTPRSTPTAPARRAASTSGRPTSWMPCSTPRAPGSRRHTSA